MRVFLCVAGIVVGVVEEGRRPYVVTIPADEAIGGSGGAGSYVVLTVPMDPRIPKIRIKTRQLAQVHSFRSQLTFFYVFYFISVLWYRCEVWVRAVGWLCRFLYQCKSG